MAAFQGKILWKKGVMLLIWLKIQWKINEKQLGRNLPYFKEKLKAPIAFQVIQEPGFLKQVDRGTFIMGKDRFLQILPWKAIDVIPF
jgi:hypothetical protein